MRKKIGKVARWLLVLILLGLTGLGFANAREAQRRSRPLTDAVLTPGQKAQVAGALRLQHDLGDRIWPGFPGTAIPVILFNDGYEFLVGLAGAPAPWEAVPGDDVAGQPIHRRVAANPQSFAVPVGDGWAASLGSLDLMNRELFLGLRRDLPPVLAQLVPYPLVTVGPDFGKTALLHEMFHVHQAVRSPDRFAQAEELYRRHRGGYPYNDEAFAAAWDREGQLLAAAMKETDAGAVRRLVDEFLDVRSERRTRAALSPELTAMEQEREWLEGVALYVEMRGHAEAAAAGWEGFAPGLRWWQTYLQNLKSELGRRGGDQRFYMSGMAMAHLLDRLRPDWKEKVLESGMTLEQLLREA
ncbi:MAG TPA: hypothetical protein VD969_25335 [Symbiobacteriaceae bacterium]|nr:hypothetical protein [Symbiobacteriaceae bacterium]